MKNPFGIKNKLAKKHASLSSRHQRDDDGNTIINHPHLDKAEIIFDGKNNILYCESSDITLKKCKIKFYGDNSVIYLSKNARKSYHVNITTFNNSAVSIGKNAYFHVGFHSSLTASEGKHIVIGDNCLFSLNLWIRTSDAHPIYDIASEQRINHGESVFIGDRVWAGQGVTILKGSKIGSGAIVGAESVVTGKTLASHTAYGGNPVKPLRKGVFFTKASANKYEDEPADHQPPRNVTPHLFEVDGTTQSFDEIDQHLTAATTSQDKLDYIKNNLIGSTDENRFAISE